MRYSSFMRNFSLTALLLLILTGTGLAQYFPKASQVKTATGSFNNNLSASETDVQKALDAIDDLVGLGGGSTVTIKIDGVVVGAGTMGIDFDSTYFDINEPSTNNFEFALKDLWVLKTGDTMTGTLNLTSGAKINSTGFTASRVLVAGTGKDVETSSVTTTELGHVAGVTSAIQTQINNKQAADADLTTYAGITPSANIQSLLAAANYAAIRALLDLEAGTDFYSIAAANAAFQPLDADLTDLADGTLTGSKVGTGINDDNVDFDDAGSKWTATTIGAALEELDDVINGGLPNGGAAKVDWSNIGNMPAGIADGVDNQASSGGAIIDVQSDGVTVVQTGTLNLGPEFIVVDNGGKADIAIADLFVLTTGDTMTGTLNLTTGATVNSNAFTASRVLIAGTGKDIETSSVTSTELGHLSGVTSGIQTQINNKQAADADLTTYAGITPSANIQSLLAAANYAAIRALLDLEAGTDFYSIAAANAAFQPLDSDLTDLADGTLSASKVEDIWVNTAGDTMTGTLNFTTGAEPLVNSVQVCLENGTNCPAAGIGDMTATGNCSTGDAFTGNCGTTMSSNTDFIVDLDQDNNGSESFQIRNGADAIIAEIDELGGLTINQITLGADEVIQFPTGSIVETGGDILISGADVQITDDLDLIFGLGEDWKIQFDEGVDDQLLIHTAKTAAIATTDPMLEILVDTGSSGVTANQQVFGVAKGSQATNTELFSVDGEGDTRVNGDLTIAGDDIIMATNTSGAVMVGDGTSYNPVVMSGDASINTSGVVDVIDSSTTQAGEVEIAIASEVDTGTDAGRAISPDALAGSNMGKRVLQLPVFDWTTDTATGDGKFYAYVPVELNGMNLVAVHAQVISVGTTSTLNIDLARCAAVATGNVCSGTVSDMLTTNLTVDSNEDDSSTAAAAAAIDTSNDDVATGQVIRVDVDAVHTTPADGLIVTLEFQLP